MAALAVLMVGFGGYMMYVAYESIHNKTGAATPIVKAKAAL